MDTQEQIEKFREFFEAYHSNTLYRLAQEEKVSINIDFNDIAKFWPELSEDLLIHPEDATKAAELSLDDLNIPQKNLRVRIFNLPKTQEIPIRNIRSTHLGKFYSFDGIVRQSSDVRPQVTNARFECPSCGNVISILQLDTKFKEPTRCTCGRRGQFRLLDKDLVDAQRIVIEESPENLEGGAQPKRLSVFLKEDLVEPIMERRTTPGSKVRITGIVKEIPIQLKTGVQSIRYDIAVDANHVTPIEQSYEDIEINEEDKKKIQELALDPALYDRMINSICPSVYGHEDIKEALVLQLVGGVKRERPDKTRLRGDVHILLVGDPGAAKCVHGETKITLNDGSIIKVKDLIEKNLINPQKCDDGIFSKTNISLPAMGVDCKGYNGKSTYVWKRKSTEYLYKIVTNTGNEIVVSPTHPMFVTENSIVTSRKSEDLKERDFIACPRSLKLDTKLQKINFDIVRTTAHNGIHINIPKICDIELARLIGYLISDSYVAFTKTSGEATFTNKDYDLLDDYDYLVRRLGVTPKFTGSRNSIKRLRVNSIEFLRFFNKIEPTLLKRSKHKQIPDIIKKSPNFVVKEFIKSYYDAESNVQNNKREIKVSSASKDLIYDLRSLLLRFNILSQTHKTIGCATNTIAKTRRPYWTLMISGKDIVKYSSKIGFTSTAKKRKLDLLLNNKCYNPDIDVIPNLFYVLRKIRTKLRLKQSELGVPRTTYQHYERGDRNPSRGSLRKILDTAYKRISYLNYVLANQKFSSLKQARETLYLSQSSLAESAQCSQTLISQYELGANSIQQNSIIESLQSLAQTIISDYELKALLINLQYLAYSSIVWDKIKTIKKIKSDQEYVYDLTVDKVHNFVANNLYCHNSTMLTFMEKAAPKARYVAGRSTTSAGITAAVVKDEFLRGWALEAGAVVLANKGLLCLDEMDKMTTEDTSALHECMAQQSYHPDTEILLADGTVRKMGVFIDKIIEDNYNSVRKIDDCEVIGVNNVDILTTDFKSIYPKKAVRISRHKAPDKFIEITYSNGRKIVVTPEHPVFVYNEAISSIPAETVKAGMLAPSPRKLPTLQKDPMLIMPELTKSRKSYKKIENIQSKVKDLKEFISNDIRFIKVRKIHVIKNKNVKWTYDITVEPTHNFISEGLVLHNSITISKANIQAKLIAETSILAAANPKLGRFDPYQPIANQIALPPALINRFDLIFPVRDLPSKEMDERIALHILEQDFKGREPEIPSEFLKKYVSYAKKTVNPKLSKQAINEIKNFYVNLRNTKGKGDDGIKPIPISARQLESLIRLAEASARLRLADIVTKEDSQRAIKLVTYCLTQVGIDPETGEIDIDRIATGITAKQRNRISIIREIIDELEKKIGKSIPIEAIVTSATQKGLSESQIEEVIERFKREGQVFEPKRGQLSKL
ncbi:MAG: LAGLIDADG family homing endonuclease [Nanoarchaeota archaeon]